MAIKFYYNGLKVDGGKLQKAHFSFGNFTIESGIAQDSVTIYARDYSRFTAEVAETFTVKNETDSMTDYFENDRIVVSPSHPLYAQVVAAYDAQQVKRGQCMKGGEAAYRQGIVDNNRSMYAAHAARQLERMGPPATLTIQ